MTKRNITIGKFEDDAADIMLDGKVIGWLERVKGERFASASSRARVSFVDHYTINLTDDAHDAALKSSDVASKADAKAAIELALANA